MTVTVQQVPAPALLDPTGEPRTPQTNICDLCDRRAYACRRVEVVHGELKVLSDHFDATSQTRYALAVGYGATPEKARALARRTSELVCPRCYIAVKEVCSGEA